MSNVVSFPRAPGAPPLGAAPPAAAPTGGIGVGTLLIAACLGTAVVLYLRGRRTEEELAGSVERLEGELEELDRRMASEREDLELASMHAGRGFR
jgi:hypothetical protein